MGPRPCRPDVTLARDRPSEDDRAVDECEGRSRAEAAESVVLPGVIVFEVATARGSGAQLRHNGGPRLDEIRRAVQLLSLNLAPACPDDHVRPQSA